MQFRKKPVLIEATQLRASAFDNAHPNPEHIVGVIYDPVQRCAFIKTLEGTMRADIGDWIITGVMGEMYPCKPDIFAMTYEPVAPQAEPSSGYAEGHRAGYVLARTEPCIGNDPACPCQDGDPCHYKDAPTTKAWPIPQATPPRQAGQEISLGALMREQRQSRIVAGAYPDGNPNAGAMMAQTPQAETKREPSEKQIADACLRYRHDFGLLDKYERDCIVNEARRWADAFRIGGSDERR